MNKCRATALPTDQIQQNQSEFKLFDSIAYGTLRNGRKPKKSHRIILTLIDLKV
jgi:hypothetical protein